VIRYPFDNAGTGFSLVSDRRLTTVFRLEAAMKDPLDPERLRRALAHALPRFPGFQVQSRRGFFGYSWERNPSVPPPEPDDGFSNRHIPLGRRGQFPFRVRFGERRIALEIHHSLTDGVGGLELLKTLLLEYARLGGADIETEGGILEASDAPLEEELEDGFRRYSRRGLFRKPIPQSRAFSLPFPREPRGVYHLTTGVVATRDLLRKARELGARLNVLVVSLYLDTLQEIQRELVGQGRIRRPRPVRLMVPVNLRTLYASRTLRNFTLFATPGIDPRPEPYSLEEIVKQVDADLRRQASVEAFDLQIARNVGVENHPLFSVLPLGVKRFFAGIFYDRMGSSQRSGMLTSLGQVVLPPALAAKIAGLRFVPAPLKADRVGAAMVGFGDRSSICFGRLISEPLVETGFFRRLAALGIGVQLDGDL
jgi:hypothetical protein